MTGTVAGALRVSAAIIELQPEHYDDAISDVARIVVPEMQQVNDALAAKVAEWKARAEKAEAALKVAQNAVSPAVQALYNKGGDIDVMAEWLYYIADGDVIDDYPKRLKDYRSNACFDRFSLSRILTATPSQQWEAMLRATGGWEEHKRKIAEEDDRHLCKP